MQASRLHCIGVTIQCYKKCSRIKLDDSSLSYTDHPVFYSVLCIQHFAFFPVSNQIFQFIFWSVEELKLLLVFPHSRESTFSGSNLAMKRTVWIYFAELRDPTVETHLLTLSDFRIKFPENFYLWNDNFY